jgi:hypothetical protein
VVGENIVGTGDHDVENAAIEIVELGLRRGHRDLLDGEVGLSQTAVTTSRGHEEGSSERSESKGCHVSSSGASRR